MVVDASLTTVVKGDTTVFEVYGRHVNVTLTVDSPENKGDFVTLAFSLKIADSDEYKVSRGEATVMDYYLVYGCVLDYDRDRTIDTLWKNWGDSNNETHRTEAQSILPHIYNAVLSKSADAYYGSIVLPKIPDGTHNATIWVRAEQDFLSTWGNIWAAFSETIAFNLDNTDPSITVLSPQNTVYNGPSLPLEFIVNELFSAVAYSLDGQHNLTVTGNTTLPALPNGNHNITIYATDKAGNTGVSEIIQFSVEVKEPLPMFVILIVSIISAFSIFAGIVAYFKRKRGQLL